jgi:hypothetical protein
VCPSRYPVLRSTPARRRMSALPRRPRLISQDCGRGGQVQEGAGEWWVSDRAAPGMKQAQGHLRLLPAHTHMHCWQE